ncbi:MAG: T9SS type A sorting domain-containing protein [Flavobacteriales bacterium]|nr:T9SS type A sorting domain-containing protein [Flavobacteriales bacterium]
MKLVKYLVLFVMLWGVMTPDSRGQNCFPVLSDNPTWNVFGTDNFWSQIFLTRNYSYEKDTAFCGETYLKVSAVPASLSGVIGYVREANKKVYIRLGNDCADKEFLLYDFSLSIGDTVTCAYDQLDSTQFWAVDIDTITQFGVDRKRFVMNYYMGTPPFAIVVGMAWIEGIGSTTHPFYPTVCLSDNCETYYELLCYDSSGVQLYQNTFTSTCDSFYVGIEENDLSAVVSIYPNPTTGLITVAGLPEEAEKITVYNVLGELVHDVELSGSNNPVLDLTGFPGGLYHLQVLQGETTLTSRIIKL